MNAGRDPTRPARNRALVVWLTVLILALSILLILSYLPLNPTPGTFVKKFSIEWANSAPSSGPGCSNPCSLSAEAELPASALCGPAHQVGTGLVSFAWITTSGDRVTSFNASQSADGAVETLLWSYSASNSSDGRYSLSTAPPFLCTDPVSLFFSAPTFETIQLSGSVTYNYTDWVPLL